MNDKFYFDYKKMTGENWSLPIGVWKILTNRTVRYIFFGRLEEKCDSKICALILKVIMKHYKEKYGLMIPFSRTGAGLSLGYANNIVVNGGVTMGEQVSLFKGVLIGSVKHGNKAGVPTIGNKVVICNNATVVGKVIIGDDVLIAAGAFVNFDVPEHSVVIGNPGIVHYCKNATEGYTIERVYD